MKRIYISGKIGEEELSSATIWKFRDAESALLDLRFAPFNPCCDIWQRQLRKGYETERKLLGSLALDYYTYVLREDIRELSRYDAIWRILENYLAMTPSACCLTGDIRGVPVQSWRLPRLQERRFTS